MSYRSRKPLLTWILYITLLANLLFLPGGGMAQRTDPGSQDSDLAAFPITESFRNSTAPGWLILDNAQLTGGSIDPEGEGWLRLTPATTHRRGSAIFNEPFLSTEGIVATFQYADYGGNGADGFTFYLIDGDTAQPTTGADGGALGYASQPTNGIAGASNGYVGIAFDEYGNFTHPVFGGCPSGCPGSNPDTVSMRGSGNGTSGYNYLTHRRLTSRTPPQSIDGVERANPRWVRIFIVNNHITVQMDFGGGFETIIDNYNLSAATGQAAMPDTFKMGFSGATGALTNIHEIRNLAITQPVIVNITDIPSLTTVAPGQAVSFTVTVTNDGTNNVDSATVSVPVPDHFSNVTWTCTASAGSDCGAASGSGAIDQAASLLENGTLTYQITGTAGAAGNTINHTAAITFGAALSNLGTNQASASVAIEGTPVQTTADLAIEKTFAISYVANITFTVTARNLGPDSAAGAVISDTVWANFANPTWTCVGSNGATCTPSGTGSLLDTVTAFPSGGVVTYTIRALVLDWAHIENHAEVIPPAGVIDPDMSNNTAEVHQHRVYFPLIYRQSTLLVR